MTEPLMTVEGEVVALPVRENQQHQFDDPVSVPILGENDRLSQTERTCALCGIVKITVHATNGGGWREWRWPRSHIQFEATATPPCRPGLEVTP